MNNCILIYPYGVGCPYGIHVKEGVMCNLGSSDRCPGIYSQEYMQSMLKTYEGYPKLGSNYYPEVTAKII